MKKLFQVVLLLVVTGALFWLWQTLFPSDQKKVRQRLAAVSKAASFRGQENPLIRVANVQRLAGFFTREAVLQADFPMIGTTTINGRDELLEVALAARSRVSGLSVEFLDVHVVVGEGRESATAEMTLKAKVAGEPEIIVQELRMLLQKVDGAWLIQRVETVKTLGRVPSLRPDPVGSGSGRWKTASAQIHAPVKHQAPSSIADAPLSPAESAGAAWARQEKERKLPSALRVKLA